MTSSVGMLVIWSSLAGLGLPLGIPPAAENTAMQHVAPEKCLVYSTWAATAKPDPTSANQTEQLLAEPEVQQFVKSLEQTFGKALNQYAAAAEGDKTRQVTEVAQLSLRTLATRATAVFVTRLEMPEPERLAFEGGLLIEAGEDAARLAQGLTELLSSTDQKPTPIVIGRATFQRFAFEHENIVATEVTLGAAGPYVLIGVGKNSVEGMFERLRAKQIPAWLTALQKRLPVERRASMSYVQPQSIINGFLPLAGPQGERIAESLGLKQLGTIESVTGLDKEGLLTRSFMGIDGRPTGLLTLFGGDGISEKDVAFVPKDATFATAFSFKTQHFVDLARHLIADHVPDGVKHLDRAAAGFEEQFGQRFEQDVLPSIGDIWTVSASPVDGLLGVVATVSVRDRAKLEAFVEKGQELAAQQLSRQGFQYVASKKSGDYTIHTLVMRDMPLQPAWCITDDRLIVGLSPQVVRSTLHAKPDEIGLFQHPAIAKAIAGGDTIAVTYQDTGKLFETTYSYVSLLAPTVSDSINQATRRQGQPVLLPDISMLPSARSIRRHLRPGISITRRTKDGIETESHQTFPTPSIGTATPVAVALLLPAVQASREASRRMQASNNLRQIMLANHIMHDATRTFPPAFTVDKEGKPLLSWRVHILPYLEQKELYEQFHLDEPWDSEHNKKLIAKMPTIYRSPNSTAVPGKTVYLGISGPGGIFERPAVAAGRARGIGMQDVVDGTSNTIAVVEANDRSAVEWTKPEDYVPNEKGPAEGLLGMRAGGFFAAFTDGSVRFVKDTVDAKTLMNLFQRADGNVVDQSKF